MPNTTKKMTTEDIRELILEAIQKMTKSIAKEHEKTESLVRESWKRIDLDRKRDNAEREAERKAERKRREDEREAERKRREDERRAEQKRNEAERRAEQKRNEAERRAEQKEKRS